MQAGSVGAVSLVAEHCKGSRVQTESSACCLVNGKWRCSAALLNSPVLLSASHRN